MRYLWGLGLCLAICPCLATEPEEQTLSTADQKCAIHYLTFKPKKLWHIEVDSSYCTTGWVQGFTTVQLKDALNRPAKTMSGFFHQGYWLSDFLEPIETFWRETTTENEEDFIYPLYQNKELELSYYAVARAQRQGNDYGPFALCPQQPILLISHTPATDFKQSLFQAALLKEAKEIQKKRCPNAQSFMLIGLSSSPITTSHWIFQAQIDLDTNETTLAYRPIVEAGKIPQPSELRHEKGEKLLTILPHKEEKNSSLSPEDPTYQATPKEEIQKEKAPSSSQSAIDLALLANVLQLDIQGSVVLYVEASSLTTAPKATKPIVLSLQTSQPLTTGWYLIDGIFHHQSTGTTVQVLSAKNCMKEWCLDEN